MPATRVAVVGMLCEPSGASEGSVAWKWALAYKRLGYEVEIFTSSSQRHFFTQDDIQSLKVHFLGTEHASDKAPHSVGQALRLLGQIRRWNKSIAQEICALENFGLVHQVSLSTIRVTSSLSQLGRRLVWGPLGGAHIGRLKGLRGKALFFESIRNASIGLSFGVAWLNGWFRRFEGTILATNTETANYARRLGARSVEVELSDGLTKNWFEGTAHRSSAQTAEASSSILWAGRLVASKRPDLAVKTLKSLLDTQREAHLSIYGDGPEADRIHKLSIELGIEKHVSLAGRKTPAEMMSLIGDADLCLFTSFRDSSSPLLLEALGAGVACAAIRMQGVQTCFPETLVPGPSYDSDEVALVSELKRAATMALASNDREARIEFARSHIWEQKAARVLELSATDLVHRSRCE